MQTGVVSLKSHSLRKSWSLSLLFAERVFSSKLLKGCSPLSPSPMTVFQAKQILKHWKNRESCHTCTSPRTQISGRWQIGLVPVMLPIWTLATITSSEREKVWDFLASQALSTTQNPSCGFLLLSLRWLKVKCCKNLLGKYRTGCQLLVLPAHNRELIFWPLGLVRKSKLLPLFTETNSQAIWKGPEQKNYLTVLGHWLGEISPVLFTTI